MKDRIVNFSVEHPKAIFLIVLLFVVVTAALIPNIKIDTDPENMLPADQVERVIHNEIKKRFDLYDMIVVGIVNHQDEDGVYNTQTLSLIHKLSTEVKKIEGVIQQELMSLSTVDNITQEGAGTIRFQWMMQQKPSSADEAEAIQSAVARLPLLQNTLVSEDNRAAGIYVPIVEKHESHRIATEIRSIIETLKADGMGADTEFHITGLPVAEDTFGVEMFKQMAISAPAAGLLIFVIMWFFFRSVALITAPMLMAMVTVIATMGLLIGAGFTVHIMSSMIPIFLMPIAVVDSVHLLSEFSDRYRPGDDPKAVVKKVLGHLFTPMFYTSVTSSIGFVSLAFTPIPPVQVFGAFVAFGIVLAFLLTVTFIPAYIVSLSDAKLEKLSARREHEDDHGALADGLRWMGKNSLRFSPGIILAFIAIFAVSVYGIQKIVINDNPVHWFEKQHEISIADRVLNEHFAGTYNAFLVLDNEQEASNKQLLDAAVKGSLKEARENGLDLDASWADMVAKAQSEGQTLTEQLQVLSLSVDDLLFEVDEDQVVYWEKVAEAIEQLQSELKYFQQPQALAYVSQLQEALLESGYVGKSNGLPDLVKTVYRELNGGEAEYFKIPNSSAAVAQTLLSFQGSHRPNDLWHMVTPDYQSTALWIQLKSGDNQDMQQVLRFVDDYLEQHPLPQGVALSWGGLTYINVIWQEAMVNGMLDSLISAFVVVLLIMILLFRSIAFGLLAMVPLTLTITFIYGVIGLIGKDYDMPVAVLSALTLGLSVDFAIHFLERARSLYQTHQSWSKTVEMMFEEPARAISRNALVIALGFTPLLLAPLVPYQTVGIFLATIMAVSCLVTLLVLPAVIKVLERWVFSKKSLQKSDQDVSAIESH